MPMVPTLCELFRAGNKGGARFDNLKANEVLIQARNGADWAVARSGGASTLDAPLGLNGVWYRLPQGTLYDDGVFYLWNDYPGHWAWEPAQDMQLSDYVAALAAVNAKFVLV
jgi:hypothetical protein